MYQFVAVLAVLVVAALFIPESSQARSPYNGTWKSSDGMFLASIKDNTIRINLVVDDVTGLYWKGTFKKHKSEMVVSRADRKVLQYAAFGSSDPEKLFVVKQHEIRFAFRIEGVNNVISLRRSR